jgi:hypothetical protein
MAEANDRAVVDEEDADEEEERLAEEEELAVRRAKRMAEVWKPCD